MLIVLKERVVVRDSNLASSTHNKIVEASCRIVDRYISNVIPRVGEVICVQTSKNSPAQYYDVVSVIHCYNDSQFVNVDEHTLSKQSYSVCVEIKGHVNVHTYKYDGYTFEEEWPLITLLKDIPEED